MTNKNENFELPKEIGKLYKHWGEHVWKEGTKSKKKKVFASVKYKKEVERFVTERINIWKRKVIGCEKPFTADSVLGKYRFCNIFREFDRQTIYFHNKLKPLENNFALWLLNMYCFRLVANTETVEKLGFLSFSENENKNMYEKFIKLELPKFGIPYVFPVSVIMRTKNNTREKFICFYLPSVMKKVAEKIKSFDKTSVVEAMQKIIPIFGFNTNFLWNEVLIDVAYQYPQLIDLYKIFPVGPGSIPTMKKINGKIDGSELVETLAKEYFPTNIFINKKELRLSAENWEGIGCEFRKYSNLKSGCGRKRIHRT